MAAWTFFLCSSDCSKRSEFSYWKCVSRHICSLICGREQYLQFRSTYFVVVVHTSRVTILALLRINMHHTYPSSSLCRLIGHAITSRKSTFTETDEYTQSGLIRNDVKSHQCFLFLNFLGFTSGHFLKKSYSRVCFVKLKNRCIKSKKNTSLIIIES